MKHCDWPRNRESTLLELNYFLRQLLLEMTANSFWECLDSLVGLMIYQMWSKLPQSAVKCPRLYL